MLHGPNGEKMSKSKGNVILPETVSKKYGIDAARLFLVSVATPDKDIDWSETGIQGSFRFVNKVMNYFEGVKIGKADPKTESRLNKIIKEVTNQLENFKYNLAVIKIRELFNSLPRTTSKQVLEKSLKLLHPICPHVSEELWEKINGKGLISLSSWPKVHLKKINKKYEVEEETIEKVVVDINHVKGFVNNAKRAYIYVIPSELKMYSDNLREIVKKTGMEVFIYATNDKKKYDPEKKSKKAKPGKPGIYLE
jgi:leucyl-tRNA synthetase